MAIKILSKELLAEQHDVWEFEDDVNLKDHFREVNVKDASGKHVKVSEFIGSDDFASAFYERQRYEVDAGRDEEPILYTPIYNVVSNSSLPRNVTVYRLGPAGVVFNAVEEGGEVKFIGIGESQYAVPIVHYATGIEYNKDLVVFNEQWNLSIAERQMGIAYNALLNHLHLSPFLNFSYQAANQTAASAVGSTLVEKYLRTLEDAITNSKQDTTNPRRGPYDLLISSSNMFMMERALARVPQQGFTQQSSAISMIRNIIVYDGWTGTRGLRSTTYAGVTANKCYLINRGFAAQDHQSFVKQELQSETGNKDVSRFILEQTVWDTYRGLYCNPEASTEEVTLPTS